MAKTRYYIVQWSDWTPGNYGPISGPFASLTLAKMASTDFEHKPTNGQHRWLHAGVFTRSWLSKNGYPETRKGNTKLAKNVQHNHMEWARLTAEEPKTKD